MQLVARYKFVIALQLELKVPIVATTAARRSVHTYLKLDGECKCCETVY